MCLCDSWTSTDQSACKQGFIVVREGAVGRRPEPSERLLDVACRATGRSL